MSPPLLPSADLALLRIRADSESGSFVHPRVAESVEIAIKYKGYLLRQRKEMDEFSASSGLTLPPSLSFSDLTGVSTEELELLHHAQPTTVHAASRIQGIRPSTLLQLFQRSRKILQQGC